MKTGNNPDVLQQTNRLSKLGCSYIMEYCACVLSRFSCVQLCVTLWLQPARLLCPWDFLGVNSGVYCCVLLQGVFLPQGWNPYLLCLLQWQAGSLPLAPPGKPQLSHKREQTVDTCTSGGNSRACCWVKKDNSPKLQIIPIVEHSWNDKITEMESRGVVSRGQGGRLRGRKSKVTEGSL